MSFARQWPAGVTDDTDIIPANKLNGLDVNQSRAVDGTAGGTYAPTGAININGSGLSSDNIIASTLKGTLGVAAGGAIDFAVGGLLDLSVGAAIADANNLTINPVDGIIRRFAAPSANRDHELSAAGTAGRILVLMRDAAGAFTITVRRTGFAGDYIIQLPQPVRVNGAVLYDDGSNWRLLTHFDCTLGAHA